MPIFTANRLSSGDNTLFPDKLDIDAVNATYYKGYIFGHQSTIIPRNTISSVSISSGIIFADVIIETKGGKKVTASGFNKSDAEAIVGILTYGDMNEKPNQNTVVNVSSSLLSSQVSAEQTVEQKNPKSKRPTSIKMSAEKEILLLAEKYPILTLRKIIINTDLEIEEAENVMKNLIIKGIVREEIDSNGKSTYVFEENDNKPQIKPPAIQGGKIKQKEIKKNNEFNRDGLRFLYPKNWDWTSDFEEDDDVDDEQEDEEDDEINYKELKENWTLKEDDMGFFHIRCFNPDVTFDEYVEITWIHNKDTSPKEMINSFIKKGKADAPIFKTKFTPLYNSIYKGFDGISTDYTTNISLSGSFILSLGSAFLDKDEKEQLNELGGFSSVVPQKHYGSVMSFVINGITVMINKTSPEKENLSNRHFRLIEESLEINDKFDK